MPNVLLVGGSWDRYGGRKSKLFAAVSRGFNRRLPKWNRQHHNGGHFKDLREVVHPDSLHGYHAVVWMPNVPNNEAKLVEQIKPMSPTCTLVVSKRNDCEKYDFAALMQRTLKLRGALLLEIQQHTDGKTYSGRVLDPLGNCYQPWTRDFELLGEVLAGRIEQLSQYTRVRSRVWPNQDMTGPHDEEAFFALVRQAAERFHELVPTVETDRFLGNSSFRCQQGFPSVRRGDIMWVSRRNVDKRDIAAESFVAVDLTATGSGGLRYFGEHKPSVDAPIHACLYRHLPQMRYALHGHVYAANARRTRDPIPCGALEEADAILAAVTNRDVASFALNLRGHGLITMAASVGGLQQHLEGLVARPTPELV